MGATCSCCTRPSTETDTEKLTSAIETSNVIGNDGSQPSPNVNNTTPLLNDSKPESSLSNSDRQIKSKKRFVKQNTLFRLNPIEKKRTPTSVAVVCGYVRELEADLIYDIPRDIYDLCLSYYSIIRHYTDEYKGYIHMRNSDPVKNMNVFEFEYSQFGLKVLEMEVNALASDQNWGNTGCDYFNLTIKKADNENKYIRLFTIDHNKHSGFYRYAVKYTHDQDSDKLDFIEAGDKLIVSCHCAPYPGWEIKVKHVEIKMVYEE